RVRARPALHARATRAPGPGDPPPERPLLRGSAPDLAVQLRELVRDGEVHPARRGDRMSDVPQWAQIVVAALLVASGIFVLISALGFLRLPDFFLRMHPPALASTFGSWCVTLAGILYFSLLESRLMLHPWLVIIMLSITVPVTTLLLARVALFRRRTAGEADTPPPLTKSDGF